MNWLTLFKEIIAFHNGKHKEPTNTKGRGDVLIIEGGTQITNMNIM
jgi:hypothetical protein